MVSFFRTAQSCGNRKPAVKGNLSVPASFFLISQGLNMEGPHEAIRKLVAEELERRGRGSRRQLATAMKFKNQSTITQWMAGEYVPGIDRLPGLAQFLGCSVADLFAPTTIEPSRVSSPVPLEAYSSRVSKREGGGAHAVTVGLLEAERNEWRDKYIELKQDIESSLLQYADLVGAKVTMAPKERSRQSRQRRSDAGNLHKGGR